MDILSRQLSDRADGAIVPMGRILSSFNRALPASSLLRRLPPASWSAGCFTPWIRSATDKIGDPSENPFEGSPNDVPITSLSRVIEIDLREMLGEREIPTPIQPVSNILM